MSQTQHGNQQDTLDDLQAELDQMFGGHDCLTIPAIANAQIDCYEPLDEWLLQKPEEEPWTSLGCRHSKVAAQKRQKARL